MPPRSSRAVNVPVVSDADTGFGEAINAGRTAELFASAGVAGIHIEDQVLPKRCGHLPGKELIEPAQMCEKIRAAAAGRKGSPLVLIARVDSRSVLGLADAIDRARTISRRRRGCDFSRGPDVTGKEFAEFARQVKAPLLANMTEFGKSPLLPADRLAEMGYRMMIYPMTLVRVTMKAMENLLTHLAKEGTQEAWLGCMQTRDELYELLKYRVT